MVSTCFNQFQDLFMCKSFAIRLEAIAIGLESLLVAKTLLVEGPLSD